MKIASAKDVAAKWSSVTPTRSGYYKSGVEDPNVDWAGAAVAAEANFETGVQNAIAKKSFSRGVSDAGNSKWKDKTSKFGPSRWAAGVQTGSLAYEKGFAPFREVISALQLPPAYPRGDARNIDRVRTINEALNKTRVG